jgi:hypothetical protein
MMRDFTSSALDITSKAIYALSEQEAQSKYLENLKTQVDVIKDGD